MKPIRPCFALVALSAAASVACSSSSSTSSSRDAGTNSSQGSGGSPGLFSDRSIPNCATGPNATTLVTGQLAGQPVSFSALAPDSSELDANDYYSIGGGVFDGATVIWHPLDLIWSGGLSAGQAVPLTGGYFLTMPDQAEGPYYCITSGDLGADPPGDGSSGPTFRFRVTGASAGSIPDAGDPTKIDCSGAAVEADLKGCFSRSH